MLHRLLVREEPSNRLLRPIAHPVACYCVLLGVVAPFAYHCNKEARHATLLAQQCWELLFHLRLGSSAWDFLGVLFLSPGILGGVVGSLKDFVGF